MTPTSTPTDIRHAVIPPPLLSVDAPSTWWGLLYRAAGHLGEWHRRRLSPAVVKDEAGHVCLVRVLWHVADPAHTAAFQFHAGQGRLVARAIRALASLVGEQVCRAEMGMSLPSMADWCRRAGNVS